MEYTEESAKVRILNNKGQIRGTLIYHKQPGLKILGAIDYLVHYHGYMWVKEVKANGKKDM